MKHYIKTLISVMLITLTSAVAKADNIKISELNWQSGSMIAYIDSFIIKHGYGHDTEIVPGGIDATMQAMVATGSPNIVGEMWTSSLGDASLKALDNGSLIKAGDGVITGAAVPRRSTPCAIYSSYDSPVQDPCLAQRPQHWQPVSPDGV